MFSEEMWRLRQIDAARAQAALGTLEAGLALTTKKAQHEIDSESAVGHAIEDIESIKSFLTDLELFYEKLWTPAHNLKNPTELNKLAWICRLGSNQIAVLKAEIKLEDA